MRKQMPEFPAKLVFTDTEIKPLECLVLLIWESRRKTVGNFLPRHLNRTRDMPPDNIALGCGMARLTDIHIGYCLAKDVGN